MFVASQGAQAPIALHQCSRFHRGLVWRCPAEALACHAGTLNIDADLHQGVNRVLAYVDQLRGTHLLQRVDFADVDEAFEAGEQVATLHRNDELFLDCDGEPVVVLLVSKVNALEGTCHACVFTDEEAARRQFTVVSRP